MESKQHIFTLEDGKVKIKGIYVGLPVEKSKQLLLEQGFTMADDSSIIVCEGNIGGLGICSLKIWNENNKVGAIAVSTGRKCAEEEVLVVFEQVTADLREDPGFDYNGYGIKPKPHEIDHFWDLNEGLIKIKWDGFNVQGSSFMGNDGLDHITLWLNGPVVKDEAYWRSEVD